MTKIGKLVRAVWLAISLGLLAYGLLLALRVSPPDADQGNMIRAFYYHFPNWIGAGVFLPLNLLGSVAYLFWRARNQSLAMKADAMALATAEMGVLYCTLGMVTGSLWGRVAWGIWWAWDARLTTTLMLWLIYVSYLFVRRTAGTASRGVICAVLAIFGFVDIPIVYMSTRWWRTQHPAPVFGGGEGSGISQTMQGAVWFNVLAWISWGALIASLRYATEYKRQRQEQAAVMHVIGTPEGMAYGD